MCNVRVGLRALSSPFLLLVVLPILLSLSFALPSKERPYHFLSSCSASSSPFIITISYIAPSFLAFFDHIRFVFVWFVLTCLLFVCGGDNLF